ncbi:MAG: VOC family protein [Fimbriimonadaceae bacterium]
MIRFEPLPSGQHSLTPYLCVNNGEAMIDFYRRALGAEVDNVMYVPETTQIMHASLRVGDSMFYINDEFPQHGALSPATLGATGSSVHLQVAEGIDELYEQAIAAGATPAMPPEDMFWGDRFGMFVDPSGHKWSLGMTIANPPTVTPEELKQMFD